MQPYTQLRIPTVTHTDYNVFTSDEQNGDGGAAGWVEPEINQKKLCQILGGQDVKLKPNIIKKMQGAQSSPT